MDNRIGVTTIDDWLESWHAATVASLVAPVLQTISALGEPARRATSAMEGLREAMERFAVPADQEYYPMLIWSGEKIVWPWKE